MKNRGFLLILGIWATGCVAQSSPLKSVNMGLNDSLQAAGRYSPSFKLNLPHTNKKVINSYLLTGGMIFIAGGFDGLNQALQFRYNNFKRDFPKAKDLFWNPAISWRNKYKNGEPEQGRKFPGSTTWLVWTTDAYHLTRFFEHGLITSAIIIKFGNTRKKWYWYLVDGVFYWGINRLGFNLVYNHF